MPEDADFGEVDCAGWEVGEEGMCDGGAGELVEDEGDVYCARFDGGEDLRRVGDVDCGDGGVVGEDYDVGIVGVVDCYNYIAEACNSVWVLVGWRVRYEA